MSFAIGPILALVARSACGRHSIIGLTTKAGHYPDDMPITGEVRLWAMERVPREWIVCAGQLLLISQNTMLFALLRNAFGGDGRTTSPFPTSKARSRFTRASRRRAARLPE